MSASKNSRKALLPVNDPSLLRVLHPAQDTPEVRVYLATVLEWKAYIYHLEQGTPQNAQLNTLIEDAKIPGFRSGTSQDSLEKACQFMVSGGILSTDSLIRFMADAVRKVGAARPMAVYSSRRSDHQGGAGGTD